MTQTQAVLLWKSATLEPIVAVTDSHGVVTDMTPFTTLLNFLNLNTRIHIDYDGISGNDTKKIASFLREWADALESK